MEWTNNRQDLLTERVNTLLGDSGDAKDLIPDIVRLVEDPEIEKKIQLDEISIPESMDESNDPTILSSGKKDTGGIRYPIIRINDYVFPAGNVKKMILSCTGFLPTISLSVQILENTFVNKNMPKDGDLLSLFMRTTTDALQYVRCDFIITAFTAKSKVTNSMDLKGTVNITGVLFIPEFNATKINTFGYIGTSREVLRSIATKFKIGFAYNDEENSNDFMNWISCNQSMESFINDIMKHAWKDNISFFDSWIDIYYNLTYININKYLLSDKNNEELDLSFYTNVLANMDSAETSTDVDESLPFIKMLTNYSGYRKTPFFIKKWQPVNNSTANSFSTGYDVDVYSFLHNQNIMDNSIEDSFSILKCIPSYDQEKVKDHIILRGRSRYNPEYATETDMERVNYDFVNTYVKKQWYGISYVIDSDEQSFSSNSKWSGNVHRNYSNAPFHNRINKAELEKMYIVVECEGLNLQVQRGEYVPVLIVYENEIEYLMNNTLEDEEIGANSGANRTYSGYYYVSNVTYKYSYNNTDSFSDFSTVFTLERREWPTPEKVIVDENNE
jgi:hypothetical protein